MVDSLWSFPRNAMVQSGGEWVDLLCSHQRMWEGQRMEASRNFDALEFPKGHNHNQCTPQRISKSWSMGRCIPPAQFDAASSGSSKRIQHQFCDRQRLWWLLGATALHVESTEVDSSHRWDQLQFCHDEHLWGSTAVEGSSGAFEFYGAAQSSTWWGAQDDDGNDGNILVSAFENCETGPLSNHTCKILDCPLKITSHLQRPTKREVITFFASIVSIVWHWLCSQMALIGTCSSRSGCHSKLWLLYGGARSTN